MKPHKPSPVSRKIDVDISDILLPPKNIRLARLSPDSAGTFAKPIAPRKDPRANRLSPSAWTNINFAAVSGLIAFFCTLLIRDGFEYSRRQAHLPPDGADLKPEFDSPGPQSFRLEPSRLGTGVQFDHRPVSVPEARAIGPNQSRELSVPPQFRPDQPVAPLPNNTGSIADRTSTNNSTATSSESLTPSRASRTTTSTSANSSGGGEQSTSSHSTMGRAIRSSRKSTISVGKIISSDRRGIHHSTVARSAFPQTRQSQNSVLVGSRHSQTSMAQTKGAISASVMSMHSLGAGSAVRQIHGATNPMRMEGGLLAQPGIGAGLGGVSGNGLGGGGGGNRGGNRVAK